MSDVKHPNMDPSGITDDNVQVKEEMVEDAQDNICDQNFITEYKGLEDIVKTEDDISSYKAHTREDIYSKFAELNEEIDIKPDYIIQSMESQDDLQSDDSMASSEFSDNISLNPVSTGLNRAELDSIKTGTLAARKLKPDLVKEIAQRTAQPKSRYQQFSYKVETMDKTLVEQNDVCNTRQLNIKRLFIRRRIYKKTYECDICEKQFRYKSELISHIRVHTGEKPYTCDICKKSFNRKDVLSRHILVHTGEKPYSCVLCEKTFNHKKKLTNHYLVHTDEKPYSCDICKKSFNRKYGLSCHILVHTGEKPYSCDLCKKSFNQKGNLTSHVRIHTGEKPYSCHICEKSFTSKKSLTSHVRVHTGEKPYTCDICKKSFNKKCKLTIHIRVHTGEKPYSCDICKKCFKQKSQLNRHIRVHTVEKPYS